VGTTAIALALVAVLAKVMGFGEKMVIAHYFGTTSSADIYFAVTTILLQAVFLVRELIHPTLLPTLNQAMAISPGVFNGLFARMFRWVFLLALLAAGAVAVLMPHTVHLFVPGFEDGQKAQVTQLMRWLLPAGVLMALIAVTYTTLNARGRLVASSLAEAAFKAIVLMGMFLLIPLAGLHASPLTMVVGAAACLSIHLIVLRPHGVVYSGGVKQSPESGRLLNKTGWLMAPIVLGVVFSHISDLVDVHLASRLPPGELSYLSYAKKIADSMLLIGPVALATVLYAKAARLASLSRHDELAELVNKGLKLLLFLGVPIACMMIELRMPIVKVLFQHGKFDPASTAGVAAALVVYGLGLVTLCVEGLTVYSFYAMTDTRTPVVAGIICVILNVVLAVLLVGPMGYLGIAAALVIAKSVKIVALLILLRRKLCGRLLDREWIGFAAKLAMSAAVMWLSVWLLDGQLFTAKTNPILLLVASSIVAVVVYIGFSHLLGLKEPRLLVEVLPLKRLLKGRGGAGQ